MSYCGYDFLLYHHAYGNCDKIIKILNDGYIKIGKNVSAKERIFSGGRPKDYVFANLEFRDLMNVDKYGLNNTFIISPSIIDHMGMYFNSKWWADITKDTIKIDKDDLPIHKCDKLKIIHDYLKLSISENSDLTKWYLCCGHEILLPGDIEISKFVVGIICGSYGIEKVREVIKNKGYNIAVVPYSEDLVIDKN
jgi:hypothetical protein